MLDASRLRSHRNFVRRCFHRDPDPSSPYLLLSLCLVSAYVSRLMSILTNIKSSYPGFNISMYNSFAKAWYTSAATLTVAYLLYMQRYLAESFVCEYNPTRVILQRFARVQVDTHCSIRRLHLLVCLCDHNPNHYCGHVPRICCGLVPRIFNLVGWSLVRSRLDSVPADCSWRHDPSTCDTL